MTREQYVRYAKLAGAFILLIAISLIFAYLFNKLLKVINLPLDKYAFLAYLIVFVIALLANLTLVAPVPIAVPIMVVVAQTWNPLLTALVAALGGSIGELSAYFAGYAGRKMAGSNSIVSMNRVGKWIERYGPWAVAFLAFQPIIPFDLGGLAAGAARMPIVKFLPALFAGKLPKYLLMIYTLMGVINFFPASWFGA